MSKENISMEEAFRESPPLNTASKRMSDYGTFENEGDRPASYGLTLRQLEQERMLQSAGKQRMTRCNKDARFMLPACEAEWVFVIVEEAPLFDPATGQKVSKPKMKTYNEPAFALLEKVGAFAGKTVEIVHVPDKSGGKQLSFEKPQGLNHVTEKALAIHAKNWDMKAEMLTILGWPTGEEEEENDIGTKEAKDSDKTPERKL